MYNFLPFLWELFRYQVNYFVTCGVFILITINKFQKDIIDARNIDLFSFIANFSGRNESA